MVTATLRHLLSGSIATAAIVLALVLSSEHGGSAEAESVEPDIRGTLGVFRGERVAADEIPGDPVADVSAAGDAQPGEDRSQARRTRLGGDAPAAYLWPMDGGVCSSWGTCAPIWAIRKNGVVLSTEVGITDNGGFAKLQLAGIVRDGIPAVTVRLRDGRGVDVPVRDNAFWVDLATQGIPTRVEWHEADGAHAVAAAVKSPEAIIEDYDH